MTKKQDLPPIKQKAITALMSSKSVEDAARHLKISSRTLFRWLADDVLFVAELRRTQQVFSEQNASRLVSLHTIALDQIGELAENAAEPDIRLKAAMVILQHVERWFELSHLARRLDEMESILSEDGY